MILRQPRLWVGAAAQKAEPRCMGELSYESHDGCMVFLAGKFVSCLLVCSSWTSDISSLPWRCKTTSKRSALTRQSPGGDPWSSLLPLSDEFAFGGAFSGSLATPRDLETQGPQGANLKHRLGLCRNRSEPIAHPTSHPACWKQQKRPRRRGAATCLQGQR